MRNIIISIILLLFYFANILSQDFYQAYKRQFNCIAAEHDTIWVGGTGYIFKLDLNGNVLAKYSEADSLPKGPYKAIVIDKKGNRWIGSAHGLAVFSCNMGKENISIPPIDSVSSLLLDSSNNIWVGTTNNGIWEYDSAKKWTNYNVASGDLTGNIINMLSLQGKDTILAASNNSGIFRYASGKFENLVPPTYYNENNNNISVVADYTGEIIVSSVIQGQYYGDMISKYNNGIWNTLTSWSIQDSQKFFVDYKGKLISYNSNGLNYLNISPNSFNFLYILNTGYFYNNALTNDYKGNLWVCGSDVMKSDYKNINSIYHLDDKQLSSNLVYCTTVDKNNNKWFGTDNGISKYDGNIWTVYNSTNNKIPSGNYTDLEVDKNGNIWGASNNGIAKFDSNNWSSFYLNSLQVNSIASDSLGNVWFATNLGVYVYNNNSWKIYSPFGNSNSYINAIVCEKNGNVWCNSFNGVGVAEFNGSTWKVYNTSNSGLFTNYISSISIDKNNNKYFATQLGVNKFSGSSWTGFKFKNLNSYFNIYSFAFGIYANSKNLSIDSSDNIWFGSSCQGILKYDGTTWMGFKGELQTYLTSCYIDKNNDKWFCSSSQGIYFLKHDCNLPTSNYSFNDTIVCQAQSQNINLTNIITQNNTKFSLFDSYDTIVYPYSNLVYTIPRNAKSSTIKAKVFNICGGGPTISSKFIVNPLPNNLSNIIGDTLICAGTKNIKYSVNTDTISNKYVWSFQTSDITGSGTSNIIELNFADKIYINPEKITVKGYNSCGYGNASTLNIYVLDKPKIDTLIGKNLICSYKSNIIYSVNKDSLNMTKYLWTLPEGVSGLNGSNFISLNFDTSFKSGQIAVKAYNTCGDTSVQLNVNSPEFEKPTIKIKWGDLLFCPNLENIYTKYQWYYNNSPIVAATNQYYQASQNGTYSLFVNSADNCEDSSLINYSKQTIVNSIFPNPVENIFTLIINSEEVGALLIDISDTKGVLTKEFEIIKNDDILNYNCNISELTNGLYNVSAKINNKIIYSAQIIKAK